MPQNIWGSPWVAWQLTSQTGNSVVLSGGTPWAPDLLPDPSCASPLTIQFTAAPTHPLPTGPFIFKADGVTPQPPAATGTLTVKLSEAPLPNLPTPTVKVTGINVNSEKSLVWGQTWQLETLTPGSYKIQGSAVGSGTDFYSANDVTVTISGKQNTDAALKYAPVPSSLVSLSFENAPHTQQTVTFSGAKYQFSKTLTSGAIKLPHDSYQVIANETGYSVSITPNPIKIPENSNLSITYKKNPTSCRYDVMQDKISLVKEFETKAHSNNDNYQTPITTVNGITYFVYISQDFKMKIGKMIKDNITTYDIDPSYTADDDGHNGVSVALDRDGFIHVLGDMHNKPLYYWRSDKPYDVTSFSRHFGEIEGDSFTYSYFRKDKNGELYLASRAKARKNYNTIGGRGAGIYHYDRVKKYWIALGGIPQYPDAAYKLVAWEDSSVDGKNYQLYQPDLRFDKNNNMYFSVTVGNDNSANTNNYVIFGWSQNAGMTFTKADKTKIISPLPMRVDPGSSQGDVIAGYKDANVGDHANILLDSDNNVGVYYSLDNATWYRYYKNGAWSNPVQLIAGRLCERCFAFSDQDNGVITIVDNYRKLMRFTTFGGPIKNTPIDYPVLQWDLEALHDYHVYRGAAWDAPTSTWRIFRINIENPTKCY